MMEIWEKLDEVIGALMLAGIACFAMYIDYNSGVVTVCAAGIISLLSVSAASKMAAKEKK